MLNSKTLNLFIKIFSFLPRSRRKEFYLLIPLALFAGVTEIFVLAIISRLFNFLSDQPRYPLPYLSNFFDFEPKYKILILISSFVFFSWFSSFIKLYVRAKQLNLKVTIWRDLSELALKNVLSQEYEFFIENKNTDLSASILVSLNRVAENIVLPVLKTVSGFFLIILISIATLLIAKISALILIIGLLLGFLSISSYIIPLIRNATKKRLEVELASNNIVNESLNSIIDIKLTNSENFYKQHFHKVAENSVQTISRGETLPEIPRALIEPFGITLIFIIGVFPSLFNSDVSEIAKVIPFLATIATACLKLTPPFQDTFKGYNAIRGGLPDLEVTYKLINVFNNKNALNNSKSTDSKDYFSYPKRSIKLNKISYQYPSSKIKAINNLSLEINVGSKISFVGETGSGKTTTANLLLQLLKPTKGNLLLDDLPLKQNQIKGWQNNCAYVQQSFYLTNSTILENIAFAIDREKINIHEVWKAIESAKLKEYVQSLPNALDTNIGDSGIKLSGGQRQRIAIARAFYRKSKLIILDEATSSLDNKTESEVMNSIDLKNKNCTLIVIAHRLSTVINSDKIYEFAKGKIINSGNFEELCEKSKSFKNLNFLENEILEG